MRSWTIDILVWFALSLLMVAVAVVSFQVLRPPTAAETARQERADFIRSCLADAAVRSLPGPMQAANCECLAEELDSFGGISQADTGRCLRSAARRMSTSTELASTFDRNFPGICERVEQAISDNGRNPSPFCICMAPRVSSDASRAAMYAYAGGEGPSEAFEADLRSCSWALVFGQPWQTVSEGGRMVALSQIPPVMGVTQLAFVCSEGELSFETRDGSGLQRNQPVVFLQASTGDNPRQQEGVVAGAGAYQLLHRFADLSGEGAIGFQTDGKQINWTLEGFAQASKAILADCPERQVPQVAVMSAGLPDEWQSFESTKAFIGEKPERNWYGTLMCEQSPAYIEIASPVVEEVIAAYPDPSGTLLAAGVPMRVGGTQATAFDQLVGCDYGVEDGAGQSCFLVLERDDLERIAAMDPLEMTLDGRELSPVAFGSSGAVREVARACLRAF